MLHLHRMAAKIAAVPNPEPAKVTAWLQKAGLDKYVDKMVKENDIDEMWILEDLNDEDLKKLGFSDEDAKKFKKAMSSGGKSDKPSGGESDKLSMEDAVARQLSLKKAHPDAFEQNLSLFEDMKDGGDGDGARTHYPGWTDKMFGELLSKLPTPT